MSAGFRQPRIRPLEINAFAPSVHYAEFQRLPPMPGSVRRLYDSELMYVYAGCLKVHFEDEAEPLAYYAGDLLLLPPAVRHRIELAGVPDTRLLGIHFDLYDELAIAFDHDMVVDESHPQAHRFCFWPVSAAQSPVFARRYRSVPQELVSWMEEIAAAFHAIRSAASLVCRGYLQLVLAELLDLSREPRQQNASAYRNLLLELKEELQQNLHLPYSNQAMARRLNVSEDYFIRLFKQLFDLSPQKYLQKLRHQAAKRYLSETDYKIEWVGALVGYDDLHNFSHIFKKWQGLSPQQYRQLFRNGAS